MTPCEMSENFHRLPGHDRGMPREKADEADADEEGCDLDIMAGAVVEAVDQKADADHLAVPERMREPEEGRRRHAPGDEIIARRNIDAERPAARQQQHQHENRNEEKSGEIAGEKVDSIEKHADHNVSFPSHAYCPEAIDVPLPVTAPSGNGLSMLAPKKSVPKGQAFGVAPDSQGGNLARPELKEVFASQLSQRHLPVGALAIGAIVRAGRLC